MRVDNSISILKPRKKMRIRNFLFVLIICSCSKNTTDYKKIVITDFSTIRLDTLKPKKNKTYFSYFIKVKGVSNDTIKISRKGFYEIKLTGKIDTIINGDYYGDYEVIWIFNPYKSIKGNIEIEYGL